MLETFNSYAQKAIIQDIYCVLIAQKLQTIIRNDCIPELEIIKKKERENTKLIAMSVPGSSGNTSKTYF